MRSIVILALGALALTSCGKKQDADQASAAAQNLAVDSIGGNDVTAIDAATASDANMAEDVELTVNELDDLNSTELDEGKGQDKKTAEKKAADSLPAAAEEATGNNAD
jgi:dsRNA-specific ribonuclease